MLRASAEVASNAEQPSWVSEIQASLQAGLERIQAKMDTAQHRMDAKLDKIGKQREEIKQGMDSLREETNRIFESVDVDMGQKRKKLRSRKNVQLRWRSGLHRHRTFSLLHSNNKVGYKRN